MPSKVHTTSPADGFNLDSLRFNPLQAVRVLYIAFVKGLFSQQRPGCYKYTEDENSEIFVTNEFPVDVDKVGPRPAVSFTRGPVQFYSLGMDDMLKHDLNTGKKTKAILVPGVMSINVCSKNALESERIAWVIAEHIWLLRENLMGVEKFFEIGRQPNIGAPSPAGSIVTNDSGKEWHCTSISSPFQFSRTSRFTPLNKQIINHIEMCLRVNPLSVVCQKGPPASGHEFPVNVHECPPPAFAPEASDARGGTPNPGEGPASLPKALHPLNPAVTVTLRSVNPHCPGVRPPSIGGRVLPIADPCVKESGASPTASQKAKV